MRRLSQVRHYAASQSMLAGTLKATQDDGQKHAHIEAGQRAVSIAPGGLIASVGCVPVALMLPTMPVNRVPIAVPLSLPVSACVPLPESVAVSVSASVAIPVRASIPVPVPAPLPAAVPVAGVPPPTPGAVRRPPVRPLTGPWRHAAVPARTPELLNSREVMHGWSAGSEVQNFLLNDSRRPISCCYPTLTSLRRLCICATVRCSAAWQLDTEANDWCDKGMPAGARVSGRAAVRAARALPSAGA